MIFDLLGAGVGFRFAFVGFKIFDFRHLWYQVTECFSKFRDYRCFQHNFASK